MKPLTEAEMSAAADAYAKLHSEHTAELRPLRAALTTILTEREAPTLPADYRERVAEIVRTVLTDHDVGDHKRSILGTVERRAIDAIMALALPDPKAEAMARALERGLAAIDQTVKDCPIMSSRSHAKTCPKCGAGLGQSCGPNLAAIDKFVVVAREALSAWKGE